MLRKIQDALADRTQRDVAWMVGGMATLMVGAGPLALVPFLKGARGLERAYRSRHRFDGDFAERWARAITFYDRTHQDPTNRALHLVGMPFIVAGTAGLAVSSPINPLSWPVYGPALGSFTFGWALNLVGHAAYEKNSPALAEDPLSFVAGPMWEVDLLRKKVRGASSA